MNTPLKILMLFLAVFSVDAQDGASLTGRVQDATGASIPGVIVLLHSETVAGERFLNRTGKDGVYRFSGLESGVYRLEISGTGFVTSWIKSIALSRDEQKSMQSTTLHLPVESCGDPTQPTDIRLLPSGSPGGNLAGAVIEEKKTSPVKDADVYLICERQSCSRTLTGLNGEFTFPDLTPGMYSLYVQPKGFYPVDYAEVLVREGLELRFGPILVERCPKGNCDPELRVAKPIIHCP